VEPQGFLGTKASGRAARKVEGAARPRAGPLLMRAGLVAGAAFLLVACGPPVGVSRVSPRTVTNELTHSALNSSTSSLFSQNVLHRWNLSEHFRRDPEGALRRLHQLVTEEVEGREQTLFALAAVGRKPRKENFSGPFSSRVSFSTTIADNQVPRRGPSALAATARGGVGVAPHRARAGALCVTGTPAPASARRRELGLPFRLDPLERLLQTRLLLVRQRRPYHLPLEGLQLGQDPIGRHTAHQHEDRR
jgi:hypothetical protein